MSALIQAESTLTDCYQTTVPEAVRRALRVGKLDKILYTIRLDGEVVLARGGASNRDNRAQGRLLVADSGLAQRIKSLVGMPQLGAQLSTDDK